MVVECYVPDRYYPAFFDFEKRIQMRFSVVLVLSTLLLAGCSYFKPHREAVPQGNLVTEEMISQVEIGMSKDQVVYLLGNPILDTPFHEDQWVYYYRHAKGNVKTREQTVTLVFENSALASIQGAPQLKDGDL